MGVFNQFPYSNFHEMNLDQIIKICKDLQDAWETTSAVWATYKDFIDNYFENLDVSEEVLSALRIMAADGSLNTIIDPVIATEVSDWLTENITVWQGSTVIDTSLTVPGAAADAKITGDHISQIKNEIFKYNSFNAIDLIPEIKGYSNTSHQVVFTWDADGESCSVIGTADGSAQSIVFNKLTQFPEGISAGDTLIVEYEASNVYLDIQEYHSGAASVLAQTYHNTVVNISNDADGFLLRLRVVTGRSVNETVTIKLMLAPSNAELKNEIDIVHDATAESWGILTPYNRGIISFNSNNNNDITVKMVQSNYLWSCFFEDEKFNNKLFNVGEFEFTVPHGSCLVGKIATGTLEVMTMTDFRTLNNDNILCFYNDNGHVRGQWAIYSLAEEISELEKTVPEGYPLYYTNHMVEKLRLINSNLSTLTSGDAFVFITDIHYPDNEMYSPGLAKAICRQSGITKVILGGDYINKEANKMDALANINRVAGLYEYANIDTFRVCGNHEFNNPPADDQYLATELSASELRYAILNPIINKSVVDENTLSYYFDNDVEKIRYFVGSVTRSSSLNLQSIEWIANELLNVPNNYNVVIIFHTILAMTNNVVAPVSSATNLIGIIDAAKNKSSYTFNGNTYNYANTNFDVICAFCGDRHIDMDYTTNAGVPIIATTTDSLQELGGLTRTTGEITEQAFDVVVLNTTTKTINLTRIGAGSDRVYSYS